MAHTIPKATQELTRTQVESTKRVLGISNRPDLSTGATKQLAAEVEFPKRSNEVRDPASNDTRLLKCKGYISQLPEVRGKYRQNVHLGSMCWFQVGGNVDVMFQPADAEDLASFFSKLSAEIPWFVFGVGSNILISDKGFPGIAIRLGREFNYAHLSEGHVIAGASMLDLNLALFCRDNGIAGLEFLSGIPGTVGGALAMNAGAYGTEVQDILLSAKAVSRNGEIKTFSKAEIGYCYRGHKLSTDWVFVEAIFKGKQGNSTEIRQRIEEIRQKRTDTQPIKSKTGGSTFKNPPNMSAWELIDKAGCRGLKIGGAQVSEKHCNFFINTGEATAADITNLITEVKQRVYTKIGIMLEEEIKIIS